MKATNMLKIEFSAAEIAQALAEHMKSKVPTVASLASHTFNITVQVNPDGQVVGTSLESATLIFDLEEPTPFEEEKEADATEHLLRTEANASRLLNAMNVDEDERQFEQEIIESRRREAMND